jgi:hypothetical protein
MSGYGRQTDGCVPLAAWHPGGGRLRTLIRLVRIDLTGSRANIAIITCDAHSTLLQGNSFCSARHAAGMDRTESSNFDSRAQGTPSGIHHGTQAAHGRDASDQQMSPFRVCCMASSRPGPPSGHEPHIRAVTRNRVGQCPASAAVDAAPSAAAGGGTQGPA